MNHANFAQGTLAAAVTDTTGTSITVTSSTGFPTAPFIVSVDTEAMLVTTVAGTTWTVTRGYEGSSATTHLNGATIYHDWSAAEADGVASGLAAKLPLAGGTLTGPLIMDNMDVTLVKLLTLHGEIDDAAGASAIDWNAGMAHKVTLGAPTTLAFMGMADLCSGGTATDSNHYGAYYGSNAFDNDSGTFWYTASSPLQWIQYHLIIANTILLYSVRADPNAGDGLPSNWILKGSNNGADFTSLDTVTGGFIPGESGIKKYFTVDAPGFYQYYRLEIAAIAEGGGIGISEIELIDPASVVDPAAPCFLTLKLVQDATGGRVVTWPATVRGTPNLNATASSTSIVYFYWDGTNYYVVNPAGTLASLGLDADIATLALPANTTISAAGAELINDANAAAQLTTLGTASYSEGTWTPTLTGFTVVGAAPAVAGIYKRIGNLVFVVATIHAGAGGNTTVASVKNTSKVIALPFTVVGNSTCNVVDVPNNNLGIGEIYGTQMLLQTFAANAQDIFITATYCA